MGVAIKINKKESNDSHMEMEGIKITIITGIIAELYGLFLEYHASSLCNFLLPTDTGTMIPSLLVEIR